MDLSHILAAIIEAQDLWISESGWQAKKDVSWDECPLGTIFILRKGIGVGGPKNGNFPLLYAMKMSFRREIERPKTPLRNIKMAPLSL